MELNEKLRLVAEYMGYKIWDSSSNGPIVEDGGYQGHFVPTEDDRFNYHENWNKLIPVCRRVVSELSKLVLISDYFNAQYDIFEASKPPYDIEKLFNSTVAAINLLNQYKNEKV